MVISQLPRIYWEWDYACITIAQDLLNTGLRLYHNCPRSIENGITLVSQLPRIHWKRDYACITIAQDLLRTGLCLYHNCPGSIENRITLVSQLPRIYWEWNYACITIAHDLLITLVHCYHNCPGFIDKDIALVSQSLRIIIITALHLMMTFSLKVWAVYTLLIGHCPKKYDSSCSHHSTSGARGGGDASRCLKQDDGSCCRWTQMRWQRGRGWICHNEKR